MNIPALLAGELHLRPAQVEAAVRLMDDGNTIPFIARYRKEMTGSLDDQVLRELAERLTYLRHLDEQREKVRAALTEQDVLTPELAAALEQAATLTEIDDIYRPYRPKRKTRASIAREKGLQPLAVALYAQAKNAPSPAEMAAAYINPDKGVNDIEQALSGAQDILAEQIADDASIRKRLRVVGLSQGVLTAKATTDEDNVYALYKDFSAPLRRLAGHQIFGDEPG